MSRVPAGHRLAHEILKPTLFRLVLRPGQEAGEDSGLGLSERPGCEPREQCSFAFAAAPAAHGCLTDFLARKPALDHPRHAGTAFSRAALRADPGSLKIASC